MIILSLLLKRLAHYVYLSPPTYIMLTFVLSIYLYSMAVKDGCSMLSVECKASNNKTIHYNYNSIILFKLVECVLTNVWSKFTAAT